MREIKNKESRIENKEFKLTDEMVLNLGKMLDSEEGLHIDEVYFTRNSDHHFRKVEYKEGKSVKYYSHLSLESKLVDSNGNGKLVSILSRVGKPKDEIVKTIPAEELVDKYLKLINKK